MNELGSDHYMSKILVFGHQNLIQMLLSSNCFAHLQKELGKDTEAVALGTPNEETQFALSHF